MILFFTYGTLMQDEDRHPLLGRLGFTYVSTAVTAFPLAIYDFEDFPAIAMNPETSEEHAYKALGEVYTISPKLFDYAFDNLDKVEGAPMLYRRAVLPCHLRWTGLYYESDPRLCYTYLLNTGNDVGGTVEEARVKGKRLDPEEEYRYFDWRQHKELKAASWASLKLRAN